MANRRGLAKGQGKGYKNVIGKDPKIHSQSAKGIKQPQQTKGMNSKNQEYFHGLRKNLRRYIKNFTKSKQFERLTEEEKQKVMDMEEDIQYINNRYVFKKFLDKHRETVLGALSLGWISGAFGPISQLIAGILADINVGKAIFKDMDEYFDNFDKYISKLKKELPDVPDYEIEYLAGNLTIRDIFQGRDDIKPIEEDDIRQVLKKRGESTEKLKKAKQMIEKEKEVNKNKQEKKAPQPVEAPDKMFEVN